MMISSSLLSASSTPAWPMESITELSTLLLTSSPLTSLSFSILLSKCKEEPDDEDEEAGDELEELDESNEELNESEEKLDESEEELELDELEELELELEELANIGG